MRYNPDDYFTSVAEHTEICSLQEIGAKTGTVFEVFTNNNSELLISALFDTGATKSVMSYDTFRKLMLENLDKSSIPHVVGASGKSLGARGRTRCEIRINHRIFYQTFIACEHVK